MWLLRWISLPHLRCHAVRTSLTVVGVALGVAAAVATTSVTGAVFASFRRTVEATAGRAALQLVNGGAGVPESLIEEVRDIPGVAGVAPLVEGFVSLAGEGGDALAIFGLDLLGDQEAYEARVPRSALDIPDEILFLAQLDSLALGKSFAAARGYDLDSPLEVLGPRGARRLVVRGLVDATGPAALFDGVVGLMDLPAAQRLLAKEGRVDRIDVRLARGASLAEVARALARRARGRARVREALAEGAKARELLRTLRVILSVVALAAVVVAFFLIQQTVTVSVVERRREIALLGALGVPPRTILAWLAAEALAIGAVAGALGLAAGIVLARLSISTFSATAGAWVRLPVERVSLSASAVLVAVTVALATTVGAMLGPAWRIASEPAVRWLRATPQLPPARRLGFGLVLAGLGLAVSAGAVAAAPHTLPYAPLVAYILGVNCLILVSFARLSPAGAWGLGTLARKSTSFGGGLPLILAGGAVRRNPASPVAVMTAIVLGLGMAVADSALISSSKRSWLTWIDQAYESDLVVTGASAATIAFLTGPPLSEDLVEELRRMPGVRTVQGLRVVEIAGRSKPLAVQAVDRSRRGLPMLDGGWSEIAETFWSGEGALVNEQLARQAGIQAGDEVTLPTPTGAYRLPVLGVFKDFQVGDVGSIAVSRVFYRSVSGDRLVTSIRVWTAPGVSVRAVRHAIQRRYGRTYGLRVLSAGEFRAAVADLVNSGFAMSYSIVFLALTICFVGVVNFFLAAILDRSAELRTLDAVGVPGMQVAGAVAVEGSLIGAAGAMVGLLAGAVVSAVVVLSSVPMVTGQTFLFHFPTSSALFYAAAVVVLAAAAGVVPARLLAGRGFVQGGVRE